MAKTSLIQIDIQNDYFPDGKWPVDNMIAAGNNSAKLLKDARQRGLHIIHVRHEIAGKDAPFFQPGSQGADIHASVQPLSTETVILKNYPNSFRDTSLLAQLQQHSIEHVVICGAMSQMCIDSTSRAAADNGYQVTVIDDACAAKDVAFEDQIIPAATVHATIMGALSGTFASVMKTKAYLNQTAR